MTPWNNNEESVSNSALISLQKLAQGQQKIHNQIKITIAFGTDNIALTQIPSPEQMNASFLKAYNFETLDPNTIDSETAKRYNQKVRNWNQAPADFAREHKMGTFTIACEKKLKEQAAEFKQIITAMNQELSTLKQQLKSQAEQIKMLTNRY